MPAPVLRLADGLLLDLGRYASTGWRVGVWASSGRGKSYAVGVIVEELLDAGIPVVLVDPEGEFWTLKEAYRTVVLGGPHADLPLCGARAALREVLGAVLAQGLAAVFDLSELATNAGQQEAARPVLEELFALLGRERRPVGVVIEEVQTLFRGDWFFRKAFRPHGWADPGHQRRQPGPGVFAGRVRAAAGCTGSLPVGIMWDGGPPRLKPPGGTQARSRRARGRLGK